MASRSAASAPATRASASAAAAGFSMASASPRKRPNVASNSALAVKRLRSKGGMLNSRAREFNMPPLDRNRFTASAEFDATFGRFLGLAEAIEKPAAAAEALARVAGADAAERDAMIRNVLADSIPVEHLADHVYAAAAMQLH